MKKKSGTLENFKVVTKIIMQYDKTFILVSIVSIIILGFIPPIIMLSSQEIINSLQMHKDLSTICFYIGIYIFFEFFQTSFINFLSYYKNKFSLKFNLKINEDILKKTSNLELKHFESSETYDMINRAQNQGDGRLLSFYELPLDIISSSITLLSYLTIIFLYNPILVLFILVSPIIKYIINRFIGIEIFNQIRRWTNDNRKCSYIQYLLMNGNTYKELKLNNLFSYFIDKFSFYQKNFNHENIKIQKKNIIFMSIVEFLEVIIDGFVFFIIVMDAYLGKILIGNVLTYINSITQIKHLMDTVLKSLSDMKKESLFISQLIEFLDIPEIDEKNMKSIKSIQSIEISNLYYKYSNDQDYVLKNINLNIRIGDKIAIVGQNGSGKTTLIKIIMGFYNDYEGDIYINGIDLRNINKSSLQNKIGSIFQDFIKYEATFRENISYGNLNLINNDSKLLNISKSFELDTLIKNSEGNLDCQIGYLFDNGKQISIGQWQKLALSRAFAKNADLYIMDEPNSALDAIFENKLSILYSKLIKEKIGIIVTHRFNNFVNIVDNIIVLSNGEIVGSGNHKDLSCNNSVYKNLYEMQINL